MSLRHVQESAVSWLGTTCEESTMDDRIYLLLLVLLIAGLLFLALKTGFVGGVGVGSYRAEQPISYWTGVAVTAFVLLALIVVLISAAFGLR